MLVAIGLNLHLRLRIGNGDLNAFLRIADAGDLVYWVGISNAGIQLKKGFKDS